MINPHSWKSYGNYCDNSPVERMIIILYVPLVFVIVVAYLATSWGLPRDNAQCRSVTTNTYTPKWNLLELLERIEERACEETKTTNMSQGCRVRYQSKQANIIDEVDGWIHCGGSVSVHIALLTLPNCDSVVCELTNAHTHRDDLLSIVC